MPSSATEQELREARLRIAALERELAALRAATPSPPAPPTAGSPTSPSPPPSRRSPTPLKPRPSIMTRRAAAAAAAAAAAVSAVANDLARRPQPSVRLAPKPQSPLPPALQSSPAPPSRSSSAISSAPPECSEISRGASELSESAPSAPSAPATAHEAASPCPAPQSPTKSASPTDTPVVFEALTPDMPRPAEPLVKLVSQESRKFLSAPIPASAGPNQAPEEKPQPPRDTAPAEKPARAVADPPAAPRRRPPPLPVVKTASTKKERYNLVAKCTEPKPGQTRYWTEEEHERFLEAVAEYGEKAYVAISNYVETRTPKQVRTHAQKFQMKMARLARQSIDAGEPVQMPAGMSPVVQMHTDGKATLVPLNVSGQSSDPAAKMTNGLPGHVPIVVTVPPARSVDGKTKTSSKADGADEGAEAGPAKKQAESGGKMQTTASATAGGEGKPVDALAKVSSTVTEENSSALTDPYMDYIGAAADTKVEMELEHTFAARLCQTLQGSVNDADTKEGEFLMSDGGSNDSGSEEDDDLADLEKLEDGDLSLAPFTNASDGWLLPDNGVLSV